jgi:hypothetical protein
LNLRIQELTDKQSRLVTEWILRRLEMNFFSPEAGRCISGRGISRLP